MLSTFLKSFFLSKWDNQYIRTSWQLNHVQQKRWRLFEKRVLRKSPFYQTYLGKALEQYPIMTKACMTEHFNEINTVTLDYQLALHTALQAEQSRDFSNTINGIAVGLSSGTSGQRGLFIVSDKERAYWAGTLLAKALSKPLWHAQTIAFFLRANNQLYETINRSKKLHFHYFDLTDDIEKQITLLNGIQPSILCAPATVLLTLAKAQRENQLQIMPYDIFSVAEVLEPTHQHHIENAFKCHVRQIYQCTEGFLGISPLNLPHLIQLNEENLIVEKEWLDDTRFIPIITDLRRVSQPIVRYRLDDVLQIAPLHESPFTLIQKIEGREGDICFAKPLDKTLPDKPLFSDLLRQHVAKITPAIIDYQIDQTDLLNFSIAIEPNCTDKDKHQIEQHLNKLFTEIDCIAPHWHWCTLEKIERHNKRRRIRCLWQKLNGEIK